MLIPTNPATVAATDALTAAYTELHPDVTFEIEQRPGGAEGDNMIKTRLATGEMADIFQYNSGSLFQALRPDPDAHRPVRPAAAGEHHRTSSSRSSAPTARSTACPSRRPWAAASSTTPRSTRSSGSRSRRPGTSSWPTTRRSRRPARCRSRRPTATPGPRSSSCWPTSTTCSAEVPTFADDYTANKAKYATTPAAVNGFQHLEDAFKAGYFNEDFGAATFDDGLRMVATGEAAHYPMLTFAIGGIQQNHPDQLNDVGFFAQPGTDAAKNGLTVWMPAALYIPAESEHAEAAKGFLELRRLGRGLRRHHRGDRSDRPLPGRGLRRCRPTCRRPSPTCCPTSRPKAPPRRRSSSSRRSRGRRSSRSPSRSARASARRPRARRSTTRTSRSRPSSSGCLVGKEPASDRKPVPDRAGRGRGGRRPAAVALSLLVHPARRRHLRGPVPDADRRLLLVQPDALGPLHRHLHRVRELPAVLLGAVPAAGAGQHADLRGRHLRHRRPCSGSCSRCS